MKMKLLVVCILFSFCLQSFKCNNRKPVEMLPKSEHLERDSILRIALDTAIKVYGNELIRDELPLVANVKNDSMWVVKGTLKKGKKGGTVYVEILRFNKKVLLITHYK